MKEINNAELEKVLRIQEEMLLFDRFGNKDAWALGSFLTEKVYANHLALAIAIRKVNGNILFQHCTEKTNLNNQNWMHRKFNSVCLMERSSLLTWALAASSEEPVARHGLSDSEYVFCGGGFPIRLKTGELVAVVTVSNLPHHLDHSFLVEALAEWLQVKDVPSSDCFFE